MTTDESVEAHLPLKPDLFQVLLALEGQARHGYGIVKEVERSTEGRVRLAPSPLYRRLKRLMDDGIVEGARIETTPSPDERRIYYRLTGFGRRVLAAEARRLLVLASDERVRSLARAGDAGGG